MPKLKPIQSIDNALGPDVVFLASKDVTVTFTGIRPRPPAVNPRTAGEPTRPDWLTDISTEELFGLWTHRKERDEARVHTTKASA